MSPKRAIIHIGIHKTGSTSIQSFLQTHRAKLRTLGIAFHQGLHLPDNHVELHSAALRSERMTPFKQDNSLVVDDRYRRHAAAHVHAFIDGCDAECVLFSAEGLSYLRHPDEMDRLKSIIPLRHIEIVVYLRNPDSFLASYRSELAKHRLPQTGDRDSVSYTEPDSWLVDFDQRLRGFRNAFGTDKVTVLDYDAEMARSGNVIPSFLRTLGIADKFERDTWDDVFLNTAPAPSNGNVADLADLPEQLKTLRARLNTAEISLAEANTHLAAQRTLARTLEAELDLANAEIDAIQRDAFWRIAKPLRACAGLIRSLAGTSPGRA